MCVLLGGRLKAVEIVTVGAVPSADIKEVCVVVSVDAAVKERAILLLHANAVWYAMERFSRPIFCCKAVSSVVPASNSETTYK